MTGKERAGFRAKANSLEPVCWLGKGGVGDAYIEQVDAALAARELIKVKVLLDSTPIDPRSAAQETAARTNAEIIQVIGGVFVLYRYNPKLHEKKKPVPKKTLEKNRQTYYANVKTAKEQKDARRRKEAAKKKAER